MKEKKNMKRSILLDVVSVFLDIWPGILHISIRMERSFIQGMKHDGCCCVGSLNNCRVFLLWTNFGKWKLIKMHVDLKDH
jgi:hypothetical protein